MGNRPVGAKLALTERWARRSSADLFAFVHGQRIAASLCPYLVLYPNSYRYRYRYRPQSRPFRTPQLEPVLTFPSFTHTHFALLTAFNRPALPPTPVFAHAGKKKKKERLQEGEKLVGISIIQKGQFQAL